MDSNIFGIRKFISINQLNAGKVVQFTYDGEQKYAVVLNPSWEGKMHAISLKSITESAMRTLLEELKGQTNQIDIYEKYKMSPYTESRPYRTYSINKIRSLREIFLKVSPPKQETAEEKKIENQVKTTEELSKSYEMYGE